MGFDQRFNRKEMISRSKSYVVLNPKVVRAKHPLNYFETGIKIDRNASNTKQKKKVAKTGRQRKKGNEPQILINPSIIFGEKIEVEVTKKGGEFKLMDGCTVVVDENIFVKKGSIVCTIIPPNKRQDYPLKLQYQEYLISQIFLICSKVYLKKPIKYFIPSLKPTTRYCFLIANTMETFQWTPTQKFDFTETGITYVSDKWGFYAIVERQPFENINLNRNGGLINSRIHPMVSLRIPKYSIPIDNNCLLQYLDYTKLTVDEMVECYPYELSNIINVSSMISFGFPDIKLKRVITVKLPLPSWAVCLVENQEKHIKGSELMLFCKRKGIWEQIETKISYTKNSFTFDSKCFGTFILVEPRSNREGKIKHSLSRLEYVNNIVKGMFLVFLYMESKSWYIWVEMVSIQSSATVRKSREERGLVFIEQFVPPKNEKSPKKSQRKSRFSQVKDCSKIVELSDGMVFSIILDGDVQFKENTINIPIISKAFQKNIDATLKKQSPVALSILQKSMKIAELEEENELDSADDFLMNMGNKKKQMVTNNPENDLIINNANQLTIIFYRTMTENYRIIEIEPVKKMNLEEDIIEKWKQKEIIKTSQEVIKEVDEESPNLLDGSYEDLNKSLSDSETSDTLKELTDIILDNKLFEAHTEESRARIELGNPEEIDYTFSGFLKITRDNLCFQIPPNQYDSIIPSNNDDILKYFSTYIPNEVYQSDFQFKFYVEPDEMREYMGILKPTIADMVKARQDKADGLVNKYLKDVDLSNLDTKVLDRTKKKVLKNISSNIGPPNSYTDTNINTETPSKDLKKNKMEVAYKVKDRIHSSDLYREPKILSNRSLQVLSDYIEHGLTLAVHLNIPDSVITELGFDSLSSNKNLSEVTNNILNHWKKSITTENRSKMAKQLIDALLKMNLGTIADAVRYADANNEELTTELFLKPPEYFNKLDTDHTKSEPEVKTKFKAQKDKNEDSGKKSQSLVEDTLETQELNS